MFDHPGPRRGPNTRQHSIATFRDALGLAMGLADDYAFVNAAILLDRRRLVRGVTMAEGIGQSIAPLVARIRARHGAHRFGGAAGAVTPDSVTAAVFISVRPFEVDIVRESDLERFRRARWAMVDVGVDLIDWIETDGDLFRSYAYVTCPGRAWPDDPPEERIDAGTGGIR